MSTTTDNPTVAPADVNFADPQTAAQLAEYLPQFCNPAAFGWERIKFNDSRTVYRAAVAGRTVYLKHFHSRELFHRLARCLRISDAQRELRFSQHLNRRQVPTPQVLAAHCSSRSEWLCTAAVEGAVQGDLWHARQLERGLAGAKAIRRANIELANLVGRMHAGGVIHCDLHLGNVLVQGDESPRLVLMDLHRMRRRRHLTRRAKAANIAQLFHDRFDFTTRTERLRFLTHYLRASNASGTLRGWQLLIENLLRSHSKRQYANRDRRIFGNNRYFSRVRLAGGWKGHVVLATKQQLAGSHAATLEFSRQDWLDALDIQKLLDPADGNGQVVKHSASGTVLRKEIQVGRHRLSVYVKNPRRKRRWKVLLDCFRPARPVRAFRLGHLLLTRRIATALPLVCLQRRLGPILLDSILIAENANFPTLKPFLDTWLSPQPRGDQRLTHDQQHRLAQEVLWQLGRMLQRLHDHKFAHRDLKADNLLIRWEPGITPEIVLVDLDGLKRTCWITQRRRYQGLMRLNVSLLECPVVNRAGRLRMLLGYLRRPGSGRIHFKPYWRTLEEWSDRKIQQQIRSRRIRQKALRRPQS